MTLKINKFHLVIGLIIILYNKNDILITNVNIHIVNLNFSKNTTIAVINKSLNISKKIKYL